MCFVQSKKSLPEFFSIRRNLIGFFVCVALKRSRLQSVKMELTHTKWQKRNVQKERMLSATTYQVAEIWVALNVIGFARKSSHKHTTQISDWRIKCWTIAKQPVTTTIRWNFLVFFLFRQHSVQRTHYEFISFFSSAISMELRPKCSQYRSLFFEVKRHKRCMNDKILLETCLNHIAVILMEVQWKLMIEHVFPSIVFGGFVTWLYTQSRARIFFVPSNQSEREDIFLSKSNDSRRSKVKSQYNLITIKVSVVRDLCNQNELIKQEKLELEKNTETRPYIRHIKFPRRIWCVCEAHRVL